MQNTKKFIRYARNFLLILIIGGLGGIIAERLVMPYLTTLPTISDIETLKKLDTTTIINKTENITISEDEGVIKALEKINASLVVARVYKNKVLLREGMGVLVTGDGYIATSNSLILDDFDKIDIVFGKEIITAEFIKKDSNSSLSLLKINKKDLTPISFVDMDEISLAQKVLLVGLYLDTHSLFVNLARIRSIVGNSVKLNIFTEEAVANGAPIINQKGELVGIAIIDTERNLSVASVKAVKETLKN